MNKGLGDLFISRKNTENAYLRFEQSIINRGYLEHLFSIFSYLGTKSVSVKIAERKLFNTSSVYFITRQLTAITELHTLFYSAGRKIVPFYYKGNGINNLLINLNEKI